WLDLPDALYAILVIEGADRVLYGALARWLGRARHALPAAHPAPARSAPTRQAGASVGGEGA
ncbi:MAG TPA: hypothetical protein VF120_13980, partial [Ktedonobacterales bacterium]